MIASSKEPKPGVSTQALGVPGHHEDRSVSLCLWAWRCMIVLTATAVPVECGVADCVSAVSCTLGLFFTAKEGRKGMSCGSGPVRNGGRPLHFIYSTVRRPDVPQPRQGG
eukprot:20268-Prymnesium_polylepis.1